MTRQLVLTLGAALFVVSCATIDAPTPALQEARTTVRAAENDSAVSSGAPLELKLAIESLNRANHALISGEPVAEIDHLAYLATRRAQAALALAAAKSNEAAIKAAEVDRERARADVSTLEAQNARAEANSQRAQAAMALQQAGSAQRQAGAAQQQASAAQQQASAAQQQADEAARQAAASRAQAATSQSLAAASQSQAALAQSQAAESQSQAALSRSQAAESQSQSAVFRAQAESAEARAADLQRQLADLEAQKTERGRVVTLGDVLFEFNRADVKPAAQVQLGKLADFLRQYPERRVLIEGYTDNVGSAAYNDQLSAKRAESIRTQLVLLGASADRIGSAGYGKDYPVASNTTDTNRALNRRVEVIISDNDQPVRPRR
jgi:outer membrane protein OmpA-like peptidoglycan-associated protein